MWRRKGIETKSNAFVLITLAIDSESRISDEWMIEAFRTQRNSNNNLVFEFCISSEYNDKLSRRYVSFVEATVMLKCEVFEHNTWRVIKEVLKIIRSCSNGEFFEQVTAFRFCDIHLLSYSFWYDPFLVIFDVKLLGDCPI